MSVYKRPGQETYSYDFRYRRQRFSGQTGCKTKRDALEFEKRERKRVASLRIDASAPLTFHAAAARYWNEVGKYHRNHVDTLRALDWLERMIGPDTPISSIGDAEVAALVAKRRGEGVWRRRRRNGKPVMVRVGELSAAAVNRSVTEPLRGILRRAGELWGQDVKRIEWKRHLLKEPQERVREASLEEEARLLASMRGDYAPALKFALLTACRMAEVVGLKWTAVDFFNREITVHGKGDRKRTIPMTEEIFSLLWSLKDDHPEAVFTYVCRRPSPGQRKGQRYPITFEGLKTAWRRAKRRAKVEDFRFHDTRHTALTRLVRATGNLKLAQKLAGHTEIATTARYAHVTNEDLRAGMEAMQTRADPATKSATENATKGQSASG